MMTTFDPVEHPHRRLNVLSGQWVLCSPHRAKRPWQGQVEKVDEETRPTYDPQCYLCPGNARAAASRNPSYEHTFVFPNDFPTFLSLPKEVAQSGTSVDDLLVAKGTTGECRVICFSPDHSATVAEMDQAAIRRVVDTWQTESIELSARYAFVQIFENKGAIMGCSNPHPHGQIWACDVVPSDVVAECSSFASWRKCKGTCLLCDYAALELRKGERVVAVNEHYVAVVPYWAYWPYEVLIIALFHSPHLASFDDRQKDALADILRTITCKYDNLFQSSFPYSLGVHQLAAAPGHSSAVDAPDYHFHIHIDPPLLRSATIKKFQVGYELFAELCRDITAEQAAARLASLPSDHYKRKPAL